ncbi:MAG: KEOPS complex subunit Pcc1 [Halodesulfurarchaeum sp.]
MHESTLVLEYDSPDRAAIVERSVGQEAGDIAGDRTTATVSRSGATVTVEIESADLVALRAGHNTWLGLLAVAERIAEFDN